MKANKRPKTYRTKAIKARLASEAAAEFGRAAKMTPEERRASALKASKAAAAARRKKAKTKP
jgi:hypothetical protein